MESSQQGKMRVALVNCATYNQNTQKKNFGKTSFLFPLVWTQLTAFLNDTENEDRYDYFYYDDFCMEEKLDQVLDYPVVLFSAYTSNIFRAVEIARYLRTHSKIRQKFILGGIHVTAITKESIKAYLIAQGNRELQDREHLLKLRKMPLFMLLKAAKANGIDEQKLDLILNKPHDFFLDLQNSGNLSANIENTIMPGTQYVTEFLELQTLFDVIVAGLADGESTEETSLRDLLHSEIEHPEQVFKKTIISLGWGDINSHKTPNYRLIFQNKNNEKMYSFLLTEIKSGKAIPYLAYETSRGCPNDCHFCSVKTFFGPLQYKKTEIIQRDLIAACRDYDFMDFFFIDDNINANIRHFRRITDILAEIKKTYTEIGWIGQFSFKDIVKNKKDYDRAAINGLQACILGMETSNPEAFDELNKGHNNLQSIKESIEALSDQQTIALCNIIIGLPTDTKDLAEYTHQTLMDLKVPLINPFHCAYLPGTEMLNQAYEKQDKYLMEIFAGRWKFNNSFDIVAGTKTLTKEELMECRNEFYQKYYCLERILETACQYYGKFKFWKSPLRWTDGDANLFLKVLIHNTLAYNAARHDQHYLSGGSYAIDPKVVITLIRRAAMRNEKGFSGFFYKLFLSFLTLLLPVYLKIALPKKIRERNIQN